MEIFYTYKFDNTASEVERTFIHSAYLAKKESDYSSELIYSPLFIFIYIQFYCHQKHAEDFFYFSISILFLNITQAIKLFLDIL